MDPDNVTKDKSHDSDSDQRGNDPSRSCNTLLHKEREGIIEGRQVKIEDTTDDDAKLDERESVAEILAKENYPCDASKESFQGEQEGISTALRIKQEDADDDYHDSFNKDDHNDETGIIGGFLRDSDDESVSLNKHHDGEVMAGYTTDITVKV